MKATLEFNLPEEQPEFDLATSAGRMHSALWDFSQWLRSQYKYTELPEAESAYLEKVRAEFYRILNDENVEL
jgi:hypothetical protein